MSCHSIGSPGVSRARRAFFAHTAPAQRPLAIALRSALALCIVPWLLSAAPSERLLYSFTGHADGGRPLGNLTVDRQGNLFGNASFAGSSSCGVVFELKRSQSAFSFHVIWDFQRHTPTDGCHPNGGMAIDDAGHLFGTTSEGGAYKPPRGEGGTAFELSPRPDGSWSETVLWNFGGRGDGAVPRAGLVADSSGNLFGTTSAGGRCCGTVFELERDADWTELQVKVFTGRDGAQPSAPLVFDKEGNLYGTAYRLRKGNGTVVFTLFETSAGWKQSIVESSPKELDLPDNLGLPLVHDLYYSTTQTGGAYGFGAIYSSPAKAESGSKTLVYSFTGAPTGGERPAGIVAGPDGRLYGVTSEGGEHGFGTVYEFVP